MAQRSHEAIADTSPPFYLAQYDYTGAQMRLIESPALDKHDEIFPKLSELINVAHNKLDITWMPEGSEMLEGWFHLEGHSFTHKDSKDPQILIESKPDGKNRYHIYFSRGVAHDIITEPDRDGPTLVDVERWEVGHLIADSPDGPWTEIETAKMHDVTDKPQMCAPSVFYDEGIFHMVIQGACFFDNHPIYHFTSLNGTDFHLNRKLLSPLYGTTESGLYDVDVINDDGRYFVVYSAMAPMDAENPDRKAINEIHLAHIPSLNAKEEAERLVELDDGLWVRVVRLGDREYGYYLMDDNENTSRIIKMGDGTCVKLSPNADDATMPLVYSQGEWKRTDVDMATVREHTGFLTSPQPGTPIISYQDIPGHNPHPPLVQVDESEDQRIEREKLEANFEWGLEGMQLLRLPNGLYALLGVCFLSDEPVGSRQRAFMAVSDKITGPFTPLGLLVAPQEDRGWGDGENGHASAEIIGDKLYILYQGRKPFRNDSPLADKLDARWQLGAAVCDVNELCRLAGQVLGVKSNMDKNDLGVEPIQSSSRR